MPPREAIAPMQAASVEAPQRSGFDKLAHAYRWMEYLSFGLALARCREHFLPELKVASHALVLGDGDGRFTAALMARSPPVRIDAVDASAAMLKQLQRRVRAAGALSRLRTLHADATAALPAGPYDLVCTHFFLDCLTTAEVQALTRVIRERMPQGRWVVSEFAIPSGPARWPALVFIRGLYIAFGILTGLRTRTLPDYAAALRAGGFIRIAVHTRLCGLLRSELWSTQAVRTPPHMPTASNRLRYPNDRPPATPQPALPRQPRRHRSG